MPTPARKSKRAVVPAKKSRAKRRFTFDAKKITQCTERITKTATFRGEVSNETKIGRFKFYRYLEVLRDEHGNDKSFIRSKWTKIPQPKPAKRLPRRL